MRVYMHVWEKDCVCACERERQRECVCICVTVYANMKNVCVRACERVWLKESLVNMFWERKRLWVYEKEKVYVKCDEGVCECMCVRKCACIWKRVWMRERMCAYACVGVYARMREYTSTRVWACMCRCMCMRTRKCEHVCQVWTCACVQL